jgi:hypothetical protein
VEHSALPRAWPETLTEERISGSREPDPESPNQRPVAVIGHRKATLAEIAHGLGPKALEELAALAKPDTPLAWYRRLIANQFDKSKFRKSWVVPELTRNRAEGQAWRAGVQRNWLNSR